MVVKVVCPQIRSESPLRHGVYFAQAALNCETTITLTQKPDAGAIDALPRLEFLAIASMHLSETELQVKVGMTVTHKSYGAGKVVGEWHSIRSGVPCKDIFDVIFQNRSGCPFLHCCRKEYLTPDPLFFTLGG
jgi:hypothetical protein